MNNSAQIARTNGDLVAGVTTAARDHVVALARYAAANPDEAIAAAAPALIVIAATRRCRLNFAQAFALAEVGYWCGVLAVKEYRRWKARPASPALHLVKVR